MLKRRAAIEPTIGHMKSDNRLNRNYLTGSEGDKINTLLSAAGYNLRKLLRWVVFAPVFWLRHWLTAMLAAEIVRRRTTILPTRARFAPARN
jgi:IS5 family transposase